MKNDEINLFDLFNIIWKKRTLIILTTLLVAIITAGITLILPKSYKAEAIILPNNSQGSSGGGIASTIKAFGFGAFLGSNSEQNSLLTILKSRKILELINSKFHFQKLNKLKYKDTAIKLLRKKFKVKTGDEDQIIISMELKNQDLVADIVNYSIDALDSLNITLANSSAKQNRIFLEKRLVEVKDSLRYYEEKMKDFMKENDIISISDQVQYTIENAAKLRATIDSKKIQLKIKQNLYNNDNLLIENLKKEIALLNETYKKNFMKKGNDIYLDLTNLTSAQLTYVRLKRMIEFYSQLLEFIAPQYEQARIEEIKKLPTFQIIDRAVRPELKFKPKRALIVIAVTFLYVLLLLSLILILDSQTSTQKS